MLLKKVKVNDLQYLMSCGQVKPYYVSNQVVTLSACHVIRYYHFVCANTLSKGIDG